MEIDEVVSNFLNQNGYKKSKTEFGSPSKVVDLKKLYEHRRRKGAALQPKLSFDINLPAVDTNYAVQRVAEDPQVNSRKKLDLSTFHNKNAEKKAQTAKKDAAFMAALRMLGFPESDAPYLYKNKDYWMGDVANRTVYCVERDCDFSTTLGPGCLTEHCIDEHQWGRYPCEFENCKFVSYSKFNMHYHVKYTHTSATWKLFEKRFYAELTDITIPCIFPDCIQKFTMRKSESQGDLERRLKMHKRRHLDLGYVRCSLCNWKGVEHQYKFHLVVHRRNAFPCPVSHCDKIYKSFKHLNSHILALHVGDTYHCSLCGQSLSRIESLARHVKEKHKDDGITAEKMAKMVVNRNNFKGQHRKPEERFRKYHLVSGEEMIVPEDPLPLNKFCILNANS